MKWAFIDYENIGSLDKVDLGAYDKVVLLVGAKQPKVDLGTQRYHSPIELTLVQVQEIQSNNLDFHLSYYLGKFDALESPDIAFDVISNDNGFTPLVVHIRSNGRQCNQVRVSTAPLNPDKMLQLLISIPKNKRPKTIATLKNHIAAHMKIQGNDVAIQNQFQQLIADKIIRLSGDSIQYN
ncbi:PIN domain-containing protein [Ferrimonas sp.]|uniref:PIN domain-containing protein n=1 Tax=Ferrimonas sp. TaxID=2080861 RepID=UPI003A8D82A7